MDHDVDNKAASAAEAPHNRRNRWLLIVTVSCVVIGLIAVAWWWLYARHYQSTDDAYVAGDLVSVMSQVSGTVVSINADETDLVRSGQEIVRLDETDAQIALRDAEARLARAVRQVRTVFATRDQLEALVAQRRADLQRAHADLERRRNLTASGAVSSEEAAHAHDALNAAHDALLAAEKNLAASDALTGQTGVSDNPDVQSASTEVEHAYLVTRRTSIRAPVSGYVAKRSVQLGERIAPGAPLLAIVPLDRLRVEANFKEVQLSQMRIGQPVRVIADLYGGEVEYHGTVAGLGMGTGAAFALLPAQNATGNWIKVVQRVPVRIMLDAQQMAAHPLRIGLSTRVRVDVRNASGEQLAQSARRRPVLATTAYDIDRGEIQARIAQIIRENSLEPPRQIAARQR
ncbi:MAG TPA: HlyD family efflux transporter periplasmic adaptor subunit [Steroidobacteraceae bacterium]|jgi:membrane fusion protein (multidrug efflux system)